MRLLHRRGSPSSSRHLEGSSTPASTSTAATASTSCAVASTKAAVRSASPSTMSNSFAPERRSPELQDLYELGYLPSLSYTSIPSSFQSKHAHPTTYSSQPAHEELLAFYGSRSRLESVIEQASNLVELSGIRRELHDDRPEIGARELTITFDEPNTKGLSSGWLVRVNVLVTGDAVQLVGEPGWRTCHDGWTYKSPTTPGLPPIFITFVSA